LEVFNNTLTYLFSFKERKKSLFVLSKINA
jgi:hypothetical protein